MKERRGRERIKGENRMLCMCVCVCVCACVCIHLHDPTHADVSIESAGQSILNAPPSLSTHYLCVRIGGYLRVRDMREERGEIGEEEI